MPNIVGLHLACCQLEDETAQVKACDMLRGVPGILASYKSLLDQGHAAGMTEALRLERQASLDRNLAVTRDQIDERLADVRRRAPRSSPD